MTANKDDGVGIGAVSLTYRDTGQVNGVEHVGVAQFRREGDRHDVEIANWPVSVESELGDPSRPHVLLHIRPHRIGALSQDPITLIEHLVEDGHALVRLANLIRIGIHQDPADISVLPFLDDAVVLPAHILDGLINSGQQRFNPAKEILGIHERPW